MSPKYVYMPMNVYAYIIFIVFMERIQRILSHKNIRPLELQFFF
jgi:hypothetical protein